MLLYFFTLLQALQEELETRSNQVRSAEKKLQHKELEAQEQVRPLWLLCSVLLQPSGCFTMAARILLFWEQSAPLGHQKQGRALPHRRGGLEIVRHWSCISDILVALPPLVASFSKQFQDGYSTATYPPVSALSGCRGQWVSSLSWEWGALDSLLCQMMMGMLKKGGWQRIREIDVG